MIARIRRASTGISKYLRTGLRKDSQYTRDEKDKVIPLYGDLNLFEKTEQFLNKYKNYKDNYLHITISYSKEDMQLMSKMTDEEKMNMKRNIVLNYIKYYTAGYDLEHEVIAYAETHLPKIKFENNKERLEHEHIVIALYNPLDGTKLQVPPYNSIDNALQTYFNKLYNLSIPLKRKRKDRKGVEADTKIAKDRKYYMEVLKDIKSKRELLQFFKDNKIKYKEVKTKRNHYFKIINNDGKNINLRGRGFEHLQKVLNNDVIYNEDREIKELKEMIQNYYKKKNRRDRQKKK